MIEEVIDNSYNKPIFGDIQTVTLKDTKICYEDVPSENPDAEVVLLLHGLTQTMLNFPPHFCQSFIDKGYRLIRIDHQGGGGSSWVKSWGKPDKYTLEDMARHASQVMEHLQIERYHLVGMSMGGMIAQQMTIDYSDKVKSLTSIMSSPYMFSPSLPDVPKKFILGIAFLLINYAWRLNTLKGKLQINLAANRMLQGDTSYEYDDRITIEAAHFEITQKKGYNPRSRDQHGYAIKKSGSRIEKLKQINTPSLVIHGTEDPLVLLEHGKASAECIPNCKTLYLEGMGHHLPKAFNEEITGAIISLIQNNSSCDVY